MKMKNVLRYVLVLLVVVSAVLLMCSCDGGKKYDPSADTNSSKPAESETSSLQPLTHFFPDSYILFKPTSGEHPEITVKGNTAIELDSDETILFDPYTYEQLEYPVKYASVDGLSVGSKYEKLAAIYGLGYGKCVAIDDDNKAVDVKSIGDNSDDMNVYAIIELSADGKISYVAPSRVIEIVEGFKVGGAGYKAESGIGDDFLIIEAELDQGAVIEELTIRHFTF